MWTFTVGQTDGLASGTISSVMAIVQEAANYWGQYLSFGSGVLDIEVNFSSLGSTTLAQAGPTFFFTGPRPGGGNIFQAGTILELQDGSDRNGATEDISIDINSDTIRDGEFFLGGLSNPNVPFAQFDLFTVLVHEIGHGLGFLSFDEGPGGDASVYEGHITTVGGNQFFTGSNAVAAFGGNVPLDGGSHIDGSVLDILNAALSNGSRLYISPIDIAMLQDSGLPVLTPTGGNDVLFGYESFSIFGADTVALLGGNDVYHGLSGNDTVDGGSGNDTLIGGVGADSLIGGSGVDVASYQTAATGIVASLSGGGSSGDAAGDSFNSIEGFIGSGFADTLTGDSLANSIDGGDGNDSLRGEGGNDEIDGGNGNDALIGGFGNDTLEGSSGADTIRGDNGFDSLLGGDGNDSVLGGGGNDRLNGGNDNDTLVGGTGFDRLDGAVGNDLVRGEGGNDTLRGAAGEDTIEGGAGGDVVFGGQGADVIDGGAGNDRLRSEAGNDTVNGGENDDRLFGSFGFDSLMGDGGADFLDGNGGNDTLEGGAGADTLIGNFGFDSLDGGGGDDSLLGSTGNDTVTGGAGNDVFAFALGHGNDQITDFTTGAGSEDIIELSGFGAAFDTFAEVISAASQVGAHVVIDFGGGDTITLLNTTLASIHEDDIGFI